MKKWTIYKQGFCAGLAILLLTGCSQQNSTGTGYTDTRSDNIGAVTGTNVENSNTAVAEKADIWDGSVASSYESGCGTLEDPYIISTGAQFAYFASQVDSGQVYDGQYFALGADLYLNAPDYRDKGDINDVNDQELKQWTPIGTAKNPFNGNFDGRGFTISCFFVDEYLSNESVSTYTGVGLFGNVGRKATITDIHAEKGTIVVRSSEDFTESYRTSVGVLVGDIASDDGSSVAISRCQVDNSSIFNFMAGDHGGANMGGIIGCTAKWGTTSITNYISYCGAYDIDIYLCGNSCTTGGIIGEASSSYIQACYCDSVRISDIGNEADNIGGICGAAYESQLHECITVDPWFHYTDEVTSELDSAYARDTGSLVGSADDTSITDCFFAVNSVDVAPQGVGDSLGCTVQNMNIVPYDYILDSKWIGKYLDENGWMLTDGSVPVLKFE